MSFATKAGFGGGLVVDFPNSKKAKKFYLVLWVGGEMMGRNGEKVPQELPQGLIAEHESGNGDGVGSVKYEKSRESTKSRKAKAKAKAKVKDRDWILHKKQLNTRRGKDVSSAASLGMLILR